MDESTKKALKLLFRHAQIPMTLCWKNEIAFTMPEDPILSEETVAAFLQSAEAAAAAVNAPSIIELLPYHLMSVTVLPDDWTLIMGPAVPLRHSPEYIRFLLEDEPYTTCGEPLYKWFDTCPLTSSEDFFDALSLAVYLCTSALPDRPLSLPEDATDQNNPEVLRAYSRQIAASREEMTFHFSQEFEEGLTDAIMKGDFELLKARSLSIRPGRIGHLSDDAVQREKYVFTMLATLYSRAAIAGGMDSEAAKTLADNYIFQADSLENIAAVEALQLQMTKDFCERVHALKTPAGEFSLITRICREYISQNLHQPITLEELADVCRQSPRTVSEKFREDTGMKVTDYIHRMKMNEAAHLLRYSAHSLSTISALLGYSSQSYFTRIFRREYGLSPLEYRNAADRPGE